MKVTLTAHSKNLNKGKYEALQEQAHRKIRDAWVKEKRTFPVLANSWKETLRDAKTNIEMTIAVPLQAMWLINRERIT